MTGSGEGQTALRDGWHGMRGACMPDQAGCLPTVHARVCWPRTCAALERKRCFDHEPTHRPGWARGFDPASYSGCADRSEAALSESPNHGQDRPGHDQLSEPGEQPPAPIPGTAEAEVPAQQQYRSPAPILRWIIHIAEANVSYAPTPAHLGSTWRGIDCSN
jgi:hypothetical protein